MVVIFQLLVPFLILAQIFFIPESPRWYLQHGKIDSARNSLSKVRETEQNVEDEVLIIREALEYEKEAISSSYTALWKDQSVRRRLSESPSFLKMEIAQLTLSSYRFCAQYGSANHRPRHSCHLLDQDLPKGLQVGLNDCTH
jgi:hypothetical protein